MGGIGEAVVRFASILAAAACAALATGALADDPPAKASLRLKFDIGHTLTYDVAVHIQGTYTVSGGTPVRLDHTVSYWLNNMVQSVDPNSGQAVIRGDIAIHDMTLSVDGKSLAEDQFKPSSGTGNETFGMEDNGVVDGFNLSPPAGSLPLTIFAMSNPIFGAILIPDNPVAANDTWSRTITGGPTGATFTAACKVSSLSAVGEDQIASIDTTFKPVRSKSSKLETSGISLKSFSGTQSTQFDNTSGLITKLSSTSHQIMYIALDPTKPTWLEVPGSSANNKLDITETLTMTLTTIDFVRVKSTINTQKK